MIETEWNKIVAKRNYNIIKDSRIQNEGSDKILIE